ncbi:Uu.00g128420.m01.CDS01 [Anthostomella pinea]|uniref:Uu.00g128420.m01.CDS01 n=1 Tax=Anthostomella pinea TaxID=933095 RepID=A0AAI8VIC2_9PEZI|nr:Uu.00g128420.m01.CDS01 [Anthostomella pinea]
MPRITVSRILGLVPLTWVCLAGTWFFLPSPVVRDIYHDGYIEQRLRTGSTVTTVVERSRFGSNVQQQCSGECSGLIFDWRLEGHGPSDSLMLSVGKARVNLTEAVLKGPSDSKPEDQRTTAYLSPSFRAGIGAGGTDHETILPWFTWSDKVLIHALMHGYNENVQLRIFSPEPGLVEIWKDITMWASYKPGDAVRETEREVGLLASFSHIPTSQFAGAGALRANPANVKISNVRGVLPSKTWPLREIIAGPLYVPTFMLSVIIWGSTLETVPFTVILFVQMLAILLLFVGFQRINLAWLFRGRGKRRPKNRGIWGAAGPITTDEESGLLGTRPKKAMVMPPSAISRPSKSRAPLFDKA